MWDQDDVHDIYRGWNAVLAEYAGDRILVAEAWVAPAERLSRYVRPDEMQQAFNFAFMTVGWDAAGADGRRSIVRSTTQRRRRRDRRPGCCRTTTSCATRPGSG